MAHTTLSLIAGANGYNMNLWNLSELLAVDFENHSFDQNNRPLDLFAPVEACTCLLIHNEETGDLNLAHYTVKEYLVSSRIENGPAKFFQMTENSLNYIAASCFIIYMLYGDDDDESTSVMSLAIYNWVPPIHRIKSKQIRNSFSSLILQLLDPNQPHFQKWIKKLEEMEDEDLPCWSAEPGAECCITLAYLCWYGFFEAATLFLDMRTEPFPFEKSLQWTNYPMWHELVREMQNSDCPENIKNDFLEYLKGDVTGNETLTVLQIIPLGGRPSHSILELLVSKGADVNVCSPTGFCLLTAALDSRSALAPEYAACDLGWADSQLYIDYLLTHKVKVDPIRCTITPVQSAVEHAIHIVYESGFDDEFSTACCVLCILFDNGASVNKVANDDVNVERIRHTCRLFFQQLEDDALLQNEHEWTEIALEDRGNGSFYDTPLRMIENRKHQLRANGLLESKTLSDRLPGLEKLEDLLKSYGAKSLHLFPVKGLPGYVAEDIEEWEKFNAAQVTASSSSTPGDLQDIPTKPTLLEDDPALS
jgi:hypothetical protein